MLLVIFVGFAVIVVIALASSRRLAGPGSGLDGDKYYED